MKLWDVRSWKVSARLSLNSLLWTSSQLFHFDWSRRRGRIRRPAPGFLCCHRSSTSNYLLLLLTLQLCVNLKVVFYMKPKDEEFKIQELFVDFKLCKLKTVKAKRNLHLDNPIYFYFLHCFCLMPGEMKSSQWKSDTSTRQRPLVQGCQGRCAPLLWGSWSCSGRRHRRWVALYRWRTFSSSRTWTGAEDEGEWKQFLSPGMKENIVLRRHRRQHRHPACRGTTRRCFVRKLHRRGAGNRQWFSLGPAAATNLGSVSLQPQWAMSGEWAEQIMGRTWLSEYVIIGTWVVSKLCFRWEMKYRGLLLLKFLSRFTLSNVSKLLLQFKLSKSNHAKGYREGSMHRIQGTYYCVII